MAKAFKVVGKKVERVDAFERLVGEAKYASDIYLPGMLYGKILRSPHPHAKVTRIDASRAQTLPGVKAILTRQMSLISQSTKGRLHHSSACPFLRAPPVTQVTRCSRSQPWTRRRRRVRWI